MCGRVVEPDRMRISTGDARGKPVWSGSIGKAVGGCRNTKSKVAGLLMMLALACFEVAVRVDYEQ